MPTSLLGQQSAQLDEFEFSPSGGTITILFKVDLAPAQTTDPARYRLFEIGGADIAINAVRLPSDPRQLELELASPIDFTRPYRLEVESLDFDTVTDETYRVIDLRDRGVLRGSDNLRELTVHFARPLPDVGTVAASAAVTVGGRSVDATFEVRGAPPYFLRVRLSDPALFDKAAVAVTNVPAFGGGPVMSASGSISRPVPKGRDDAREFFSFGLQSEDGEDTQFAIDLKIAESFLLLGRGWSLVGGGEAKISSEASGFVNRLVFTGGTRKIFLLGSGLDAIDAQLKGAVETDKEFDNTNVLADLELFFVFPALSVGRLRYDPVKSTYTKRAFYGYLHPYIGFEYGRNAGFGSERMESGTVSRLTMRLAANASFSLGGGLESISFDATYSPRVLLTDEIVAVEENDVFSDQTIDNGWIHYFRGSGSLGFTPNFAFSVTYEKGRLPPVFKETAKWSAGLTLKG